MTKITSSIDLTPTNYSPDDVNDIDSHMDAIEAKLKAIHNRVGHIIFWPVETLPDWALICNGQSVKRAAYPELYEVIGDMYGAATMADSFRLPTYGGRFFRGHDNGASTDPDAGSRSDRGDGTSGDAVGTTQASAINSHRHGWGKNTNQTTGGGGGRMPSSGSSFNMGTSGGAYEDRPDNKTVFFLIIHGAGV